MLAMFSLRDRRPAPQLVPWAGEFVGKYLISAIQASRLDPDAQLDQHIRQLVSELVRCQAEDGYLGPFPQAERLLQHWDLWGHYHIILALLMWHERTGDQQALDAACRAADLACQIYLSGDRRPRQAGSTEMNLAIIHGLGRLYRQTKEPRYLALMREIEKDWEQEGDYFRTGLQGVDFYQTPKPRWESLHDLQGLVELFLITGDAHYSQAFLHHWHSIQRLDRRNTGGFSSGEQATGTPFEPTAIETCCTIAWMALTVDALRLTGHPLMADELERSTFNGMLGAQHPSGCWWTYNTPMDGVREASHDTIVFQSRAGTPDLNCCSVNAPRGIGMLSEWSVMRTEDGLAVNAYLPLEVQLTDRRGNSITLQQGTTYPLDGNVVLRLQLDAPAQFTLRLRIPTWSKNTTLQCRSAQGEPIPLAGPSRPRPGSYCLVTRRWQSGDEIYLGLDMSLRCETGGGPMAGKISVFRGPLLLAYDVLQNDSSEPAAITPGDLRRATVTIPPRDADSAALGLVPPWILVDIPRAQGVPLRLCDFASAGSRGSTYYSWLPAEQVAPPCPVPLSPPNNASVPPGRMLFLKRPDAAGSTNTELCIEFAESPDFRELAAQSQVPDQGRAVIPAQEVARLQPKQRYYWRMVARNQWGESASAAPYRTLTVDPSLPPLTDAMLTRYGENAQGLIISASLGGTPDPDYGTLLSARGWQAAAGVSDQPQGSVQLDGQQGMLVYQLREFPVDQYTCSIWCQAASDSVRLGQVFSAWSRGMDDPLRICIQGGQLTARIEAGQVYSTHGVAVEPGRWMHICAVKQRDQLSLYVNGQKISTVSVPTAYPSAARDLALGGNPHYTGSSEHLACRLAQFTFWARALDEREILKLAQPNHSAR